MATPNLPLSDREAFRNHDAQVLNELWAIGEKMAAQAFEVQPKPDPLTIALNGFPDVNSYRAYYEGVENDVE